MARGSRATRPRFDFHRRLHIETLESRSLLTSVLSVGNPAERSAHSPRLRRSPEPVVVLTGRQMAAAWPGVQQAQNTPETGRQLCCTYGPK